MALLYIRLCAAGRRVFWPSHELGTYTPDPNFIREQILAECAMLEAPHDPYSALLLQHALRLGFRQIPRITDAYKFQPEAWMCHANAQEAVRRDRTGKTRAVYGWWNTGAALVFHSVVERDGQMFCITPVVCDDQEIGKHLQFAEDPRIRLESVDENFNFKIFKKTVPTRLTLSRDVDLYMARQLRMKLMAGVDPVRIAREPIILT